MKKLGLVSSYVTVSSKKPKPIKKVNNSEDANLFTGSSMDGTQMRWYYAI